MIAVSIYNSLRIVCSPPPTIKYIKSFRFQLCVSVTITPLNPNNRRGSVDLLPRLCNIDACNWGFHYGSVCPFGYPYTGLSLMAWPILIQDLRWFHYISLCNSYVIMSLPPFWPLGPSLISDESIMENSNILYK